MLTWRPAKVLATSEWPWSWSAGRHFASIFTRALEAGHWPLGDIYEYSTGIAFVVVTVCVVLMVRSRMRLIGLRR